MDKKLQITLPNGTTVRKHSFARMQLFYGDNYISTFHVNILSDGTVGVFFAHCDNVTVKVKNE